MKHLAFVLLGAGALFVATEASAADKVTLQLKWVTQAQFAGYYVAKEKGFYKDENLDVTIKPGGPDIAPEQVLDPVELDVRADVYALAGTIYNVTTGRAFFDEVESPRERILAHMRRDPFAEGERLRAYPAAVAKLLRAATVPDPRDRPMPLEFGRAFAEAL